MALIQIVENKKKSLGIYVHIPFCRSKCEYCDFYSVPGARSRDLMDRYLDAVILHIREAHGDALELLRARKGRLPRGVVHCYSGSAEDAVQLAAQGLYIGFGGACTFNGAKRAAKAIEALPLDAIVLETDCPYMAPVPYRGKRCDSSMIPMTAGRMAEEKGCTLEEMLRQTGENAKRLFSVK